MQTFLNTVLKCPACGKDKILGGSKDYQKCANCSSKYYYDGSVLVVNNTKYYWGEVERKTIQNFLNLLNKFGSNKAFTILSEKDPKEANWLKTYLLDESRADWKFILPKHNRGSVLDIGAGFGIISSVLSEIYDQVVSLEITLERIKILEMLVKEKGIKNVYPIKADALNLPFKNNSFDVVTLMGVLEWVGESDKKKDVGDIQSELLSNINKILKPGGLLVLGIENRFDYEYFIGGAEHHTNLKYLSLLPRSLAKVYYKKRTGREFRVYTYSLPGYKNLLKKSGFTNVNYYAAMPKYSYPRFISPLGEKSNFLNKYIESQTKKRAFLLNLIKVLGLWSYLAPTYILVARKNDD